MMAGHDKALRHWLGAGDTLLLLAAVLLLTILYLQFWQLSGRNSEALVMVNGQTWARLNLFQDQDLAVPGPLGESHIQVRNGSVRFVDSPCPNKLCVLQGKLQQGGEVAVCLPNLVSIKIPAADPRFDSINF